jgi:hypothetical protein
MSAPVPDGDTDSDTDSDTDPRAGTRRAGVVSDALAAAALLVAAVAFWVAGAPYGRAVLGVVLYPAGLLLGVVGSVLLWMAAGGPGRALVLPAVGLALCFLATVLSLGRAVPGAVQVVLMAVTGVVLAAGAVGGRR